MQRLLRRYREEHRRTKRSDDTAAAMPEAEPAASAARDLRENQIESEPNQKTAHEVSVVNSQRQWTAKGRRDRTKDANWRSVENGPLVKTQQCPGQRQQTPDEELL